MKSKNDFQYHDDLDAASSNDSFLRVAPLCLMLLATVIGTTALGFRLVSGQTAPSFSDPLLGPLMILGVPAADVTTVASAAVFFVGGSCALAFVSVFFSRRFALPLTFLGATTQLAVCAALLIGCVAAGGLADKGTAPLNGNVTPPIEYALSALAIGVLILLAGAPFPRGKQH